MIDQIISVNMTNIQSENLTKLMIFVTNLGNKYAIILFSIIVSLLLIYHKKNYIKTKIFILSILLGTIFSQGLKYLIKRARPEIMLINQDGYSFPSGHATLSLIFFGMLIYLFYNEIKNYTIKYLFVTINILLIIGISFSRIYLNVHWLTDIIGGILLGLICMLAAIKISKKYLKKIKLY